MVFLKSQSPRGKFPSNAVCCNACESASTSYRKPLFSNLLAECAQLHENNVPHQDAIAAMRSCCNAGASTTTPYRKSAFFSFLQNVLNNRKITMQQMQQCNILQWMHEAKTAQSHLSIQLVIEKWVGSALCEFSNLILLRAIASKPLF